MNEIVTFLTDNAIRVGLIDKSDKKLFESMCRVAYTQGIADYTNEKVKKTQNKYMTEEQYIDAVQSGEIEVNETKEVEIL